MNIIAWVSSFLLGRPDTGVTLDLEALGQARQAIQVTQSVRRDLKKKNESDRFLRGVMDGMQR